MDIKQSLLERAESKCELCTAETNLEVYNIPPVNTPNVDNSILICNDCYKQINGDTDMDSNHWRCLNNSMWSIVPSVQVMAWRVLNKLSSESWARDLLDTLYLEDDILTWAKSAEKDEENTNTTPTKDSNGTILCDGDTVTLIKDLVVKGAGFTAKRGTTVKNISLTSNPEHIEGRVNGTQIVLLSCFLKKSN